MTNYMNFWIKQAFEKLRGLRGNKCYKCEVTESLEFAHTKETELKGMGRGRKERYYDIIKNPDCYVLACKEHHGQIEVKLYSVKT